MTQELSYKNLPDYFYSPSKMAEFPKLEGLVFNKALGNDLGIGHFTPHQDGIALAYAGHQFGHFAMLGDGRAMLIDEIRGKDGRVYDIHLKGSGPTAFSRRGDGKASLGPMLREFVIGESLHALGIPTSRILAVYTTGEKIIREKVEQGAILVRIAQSHIRVGSFEFASASGKPDAVKKLSDYSISRHFPELSTEPNPYLAFLAEVFKRQAKLIAQWMGIGFIHGVMNTDNMSISGESLDFGPCAFMDYFSDSCVFSSIDQAGRYAYGNQPAVAYWNLSRFAETLLPLLDENHDRAVELAKQELANFEKEFTKNYYEILSRKLGLDLPDQEKVNSHIKSLSDGRTDFTSSFSIFPGNPLYIPRNMKLKEALEAAENGDMRAFHQLIDIIKNPYTKQEGREDYENPPSPEISESFISYCGT